MRNTPLSEKKKLQIGTVFLYVVAQFLVIYMSLGYTNGKFIYALDDPYIHLSVAEMILEGGYGINVGEYASPSSSILYPFLLAFLLLTGLGEFSPLVISFVFSVLSLWILSGYCANSDVMREDRFSKISFFILPPALILATNSIALTMTGMEHSIHVFATISALTGLKDLVENRATSVSLIKVVLGVLLCSVIRFEGLALTVAMIIALFILGHRLMTLALAFLIPAILSIYVVGMMSLGLPAIPSSVMVKSGVAAEVEGGSFFKVFLELFENFRHSLDFGWGIAFFFSGIFFLYITFAHSSLTRNYRIFFAVPTFILLAHVFAGRYGWFGRYESYAVAALIIGIFSAPRRIIPFPLPRIGHTLAVLAIGLTYVDHIRIAPLASLNIYQQQYQMHRFATEFYPEKVAVNDLGYVSFKNDSYVLDLYGLGSEYARQLSRHDEWTPDLLTQITEKYDINFAMIYDHWFENIPPSWCRVGVLQTSMTSTASNHVAFYLFKPESEGRMRSALESFSDSLPNGASFHSFPCRSWS
ncbi:MAG: hypothetical protein HUJ27_14955 [Rhodobacteraceae bacterium]|nr:hypothetical protein [Paracoccaceae bacterium]